MSMYYQLCDENDKLRNSVSMLGHRVSKLEKENAELRRLLKEIVGDHNAAYAVGIISTSFHSVKKAGRFLEELEAKNGKNND